MRDIRNFNMLLTVLPFEVLIVMFHEYRDEDTIAIYHELNILDAQVVA